MKYFFLLLLVFALIFTVTRCEQASSPIGVTTENNADVVTKAKPDKPGAGFAAFHLTGDVLCVPPYGTIDIPGSGGKVIYNQPNGKMAVLINSIVNGLKPNFTYKLYLRNYKKPGAPPWGATGCSYGNWTYMGSFITDDKGHGDFQIKILKDEMPAGEYNFSVWINDVVAGRTLLVSDNFTVTIAGGVVI